MKVFFTSFATLQDVNGWPQRVIAQYYQVILNMTPLPWQKLVSESFGAAQFKHKQQPAEPDEPPPSQKIQDAETAQPPGPAEAAGAQEAQLFSGGYCKSILAHIDPQNSMADAISQHLAMDLEGSDLSDLEGLRDIISKRLMLIDKAYAAQDETMTMLLQDADKMSKEQAALLELRCGCIEAQERVDARVAQKKEEQEMAQAQVELGKLKEEQAQQILSQMDAIGLSPEALLELHQKRQKDGKKPIPEDQVSEPPGTSKPEAAVPSEADRAEFESCGPATKKARLEEPQQSSEMVEVIVEEEIE